MSFNIQIFHSQTQILPTNLPHASTLPQIPKQTCRTTRRELAIRGSSSALLLLSAIQTLDPLGTHKALAENDVPGVMDSKNEPKSCNDLTPTKRVFFDVSVDGESVGRIVIGLFGDDFPAGTSRFSALVSGALGISYRRKEFVKIMPNFIQNGGIRSFGVDLELAQKSSNGFGVENLVTEWEKMTEKCNGVKNFAGSVSIIVRDPYKPPPNLKLVAKQGKLEINEEQNGVEPNGTEFVIATKESPELDKSALVIGRVLDGMDVLQRISMVKTVQENTGSPYFRVAKLIGDKRAVVAERGFNRPYSKIVVTNCGLID